MSKDDICLNFDLEVSRDEDVLGNGNSSCYNCQYCFEDDDLDLMRLFYNAEIWFSDGKDES